MTWGMIARAASVYAKDQIADWTEGSRFEPYTSQWDNPEWYDYVSAAASGYSGAASGYVNAAGKVLRQVASYQDDPDSWDYRGAIGDALGVYGGARGAGGAKMPGSSYARYGKNLVQYLPDKRERDELATEAGANYNDDRFYNANFRYKPDFMTDVYRAGQDIGSPYKGPDRPDNSDVDQSIASQMAGSDPTGMASSYLGIAGGLLDMIFNTNENSRPDDPYWNENED